MTDPVDTDALRAFGQGMKVEVPDHPYLAKQVINAADEVERLRAVIENAPHDRLCLLYTWQQVWGDCDGYAHKCTCWKADAL